MIVEEKRSCKEGYCIVLIRNVDATDLLSTAVPETSIQSTERRRYPMTEVNPRLPGTWSLPLSRAPNVATACDGWNAAQSVHRPSRNRWFDG